MGEAKFTITGASGWLGQEIIYYLLNNSLVAGLDEFQLFSSTEKLLDFGKFGSIRSKSLLKLDESDLRQTNSFIHLAFLTREKVSKYGFKKYVETNEALTRKAVDIIKECNPISIVNVSSGAVFNSTYRDLATNYEENPYGFGKLMEERILCDSAVDLGANIVIGRLWGCTGRYMPINRAYAISDLIYSAMTRGEMKINSPHKVWRRYIDAGEFLYVLYKLSLTQPSLIFDSGGSVIEIGELARLISDELGGIPITRPNLDSTVVDDYYPQSDLFDNYARGLGVSLANLNFQVSRTVAGHRSQLESGFLKHIDEGDK